MSMFRYCGLLGRHKKEKTDGMSLRCRSTEFVVAGVDDAVLFGRKCFDELVTVGGLGNTTADQVQCIALTCSKGRQQIRAMAGHVCSKTFNSSVFTDAVGFGTVWQRLPRTVRLRNSFSDNFHSLLPAL
jgi:hypothetical protein